MVTIAKTLSDRITLNDGVTMPLFGLGTYQCRSGLNGEAENAVSFALEQGYTLIDTAEFYYNESDVGNALKNLSVNREDVFIVTKVWNHGYDTCINCCKQSLKKLQLSYIDLYLIHHPLNGDILPTYDAMLKLKQDGLVRSIGVSNFGVHHLEELEKAGRPKPSVNQIQLNPYFRCEDIVKYCREKGIAVMGYSPLSKAKKMTDPILLKIAQKYYRTVPQLLIRWSLQNGYITIPKTSKPARIIENADVFDWSITEEDMALMNSISAYNCTWDPTLASWEG